MFGIGFCFLNADRSHCLRLSRKATPCEAGFLPRDLACLMSQTYLSEKLQYSGCGMKVGEKRTISSKECLGHSFNYYSPNAVNSTKLFKYLTEKGYCWFLEPFAMLFMQLKGEVEAEHSKLIMGRQSKTRAYNSSQKCGLGFRAPPDGGNPTRNAAMGTQTRF